MSIKVVQFQRECRGLRSRAFTKEIDVQTLKVQVDAWRQQTYEWFQVELPAYSELLLRPPTTTPGYREGFSIEANNLGNGLSQYLENLAAIQVALARERGMD